MQNDPFGQHKRSFRSSKLVYPVVSRRSGGLSIGVNLNPDKSCNFNCLYCQVHRAVLPAAGLGRPANMPAVEFSLEILADELRWLCDMAVTGRIYDHEPFDRTARQLRRLNDIALSGDGEPTACEQFLPAVCLCVSIKDALSLESVEIVLITNASRLDIPNVIEALELLDSHNGRIWAKLDAGSEDYFSRVNRTAVPFERILSNICLTARRRPIFIQSLFANIEGEPPSPAEIDAYIGRLKGILDKGGQIAAVQLLTTARRPAEPFVTALTHEQLDEIADRLADKLPIDVQRYYGL